MGEMLGEGPAWDTQISTESDLIAKLSQFCFDLLTGDLQVRPSQSFPA